jgi:hypothetical protein
VVIGTDCTGSCKSNLFCFNSNVSNLYNNDVIKKSLKSCHKSYIWKQKLKSVNYVQQYNYIMNYNNIDHYLTAHFKCKLFQHVIIYVW